MTISSELEAHIVRLYHVEKWRCGTIARQLKIHRDAVRRVLAQSGSSFYASTIKTPPSKDGFEPALTSVNMAHGVVSSAQQKRLPTIKNAA